VAAASKTTDRNRDGAWLEQHGATVCARVAPGCEDALLEALGEIGARVAATGEPYRHSPNIHYARFVFIPGARDGDGETIPASLIYLGDFDGSVEDHLDEIAALAAADFDRISAFCQDPVPTDPAGRRAWLGRHLIADANYYVNTIGRTVRQIRDEAGLRKAIEDFIDGANLPADDPEAVRQAIRTFVGGQDDLQWALQPLPSDRRWRRERKLALILGFGIGIPVAILLLPVIIVWALILRWHERKDPDDPTLPDPAHVADLASLEDHTLQNQFSALGFVKPGWFRLTTATVLLWIGRWGTRYLFGREDLAGVKTIHFARWTFIDNKRRMLFASNYDGSLENYMGDFIDIVAWGLNGIFSNGIGYPRTRWLIVDGAWDEITFKRHIRNRQIPSQVWYCAYPNLSALVIAENARIRAGLVEVPVAEQPSAFDWLKPLRRNWGRPKPATVALERDDMQGLLVRGHSSQRSACFLLLRFGEGGRGAAGARAWLRGLLDEVSNGGREKSEHYVHVAFTAGGLQRLGCPDAAFDGFSNEFRFGMATEHRQRILGDDGDSAPEHWSWGGPSDAIDALLLVYAKTEASLAEIHDRLSAGFAGNGVTQRARFDTSVMQLEGDPFGREHFGFNDGLTTPPIEGLSKGGGDDSIKAGEFFLGYQNEYGRYTARPLVPAALDPGGILPDDVEGSGARDLGRNGTYLIFRQLHQHVHRFWQAMDAALKPDDANGDEARIRVASKMVGRWPGGAPLTLSPDGDDPSLAGKDFVFHAADREGQACPVGAHIRRTNPRDSLDPRPGTAESLAVNKRHRLLRRGRTYGAPLDQSMQPAEFLAKGDDGAERGLHFICLAANIARQFEFIQASWANNPQFERLVDDVDPLIGRRGRFTHPDPNGATASFTIPGKPARQRLHNLPDFVTVRGGAYFFMPGIRALKFLAADRPS
jgi:Dyp-type peroxidase family